MMAKTTRHGEKTSVRTCHNRHESGTVKWEEGISQGAVEYNPLVSCDFVPYRQICAAIDAQNARLVEIHILRCVIPAAVVANGEFEPQE